LSTSFQLNSPKDISEQLGKNAEKELTSTHRRVLLLHLIIYICSAIAVVAGPVDRKLSGLFFV